MTHICLTVSIGIIFFTAGFYDWIAAMQMLYTSLLAAICFPMVQD